MLLGFWLPTFTEGADFRTLTERARQVERAGFSGIYLLDHLLPISGVHESSWLETVVGLTMLATCTERVTIGTASMVVGFRHPVLLAKQIASIAVLAGPRLVLGASSGWFAPEYDALGYRIEERAFRTDETLAATRELLSREGVSFKGRHWSFDDVTIAPRPEFQVPIVIGGGSRTPEAGSDFDRSTMVDSVLSRIVQWDGWLAPCAGKEEMTYSDLDAVRAGLAANHRQPPFKLLHVQWTYVVDTDDRERALREQLPRFRSLMGQDHTDQHFIDTYLLGSRTDIQDRVARLRHHGFDELIVGPVTHDPSQIELIADAFRPAVE